MSLMPKPIQTDENYVSSVLASLEEAHASLFGKDSKYHTGFYIQTLDKLWRIFQQVLYKNPPLYGDDYLVPTPPLFYRQPVWDLLDDVLLQEESFTIFSNQQERAEKFLEILTLVMRQKKLQEHVIRFIEEIKKIKPNLDFGEAAGSIWITLDKELTGANAKVFAEKVVPKMIEAVTSFMENK